RFAKPRLAIPERVLEELREDLEGMVDALRTYGVTVHRPVRLTAPVEIKSPFWSSYATPALNVRDQTIILGTTIVETAPHVRSRYFENDYLKPIFLEYFRAGSRWLAMPRPVLSRGTLDPAYYRDNGYATAGLLEDEETAVLDGLGHEIVFDGAQCIRLGRDVLVNVANRNHELGYSWLVRHFGEEFTFHKLDRMADSHIDSILAPLRPGLMILRSEAYRDLLPESMRGWDAIYCPEVSESRFPDYGEHGFNLASRFIDLNVLSLDENTVVANSLCPELLRALERRGIDIIPVRHRHRRLFSGGFHCFTLDCVRAGGSESYL
ncbi:MAG TPA: inosamine-phosphate amidinotransferase 1, partial [Chloroflexota bacterium]|nr:inosamine-phosphate amidinotransferase 1 [Chloroflexota bacterium]